MQLRFIYMPLFVVLFSCSRHKSSDSGLRFVQGQTLSYQLERSMPRESAKTFPAPGITLKKDPLAKTKQAAPPISKKDPGVIEKNIETNTYVHPGEIKMQKRIGPFNIKKDNVFFKIGSAVLAVGLVVLGLFGSVFISISSSGGVFFLGGLLIGLAVCLLSLPFFLLGIITEFMKRNSQPVENPNEI